MPKDVGELRVSHSTAQARSQNRCVHLQIGTRQDCAHAIAGSSRRKHQRLRVDGIEPKPSASQSLDDVADDVASDKRVGMQPPQTSSRIDLHDGCTTSNHWRPPSPAADRRISNSEGLLPAPLSPSEPDEAKLVEMPGSSPTDADTVAANFIKAISLSSLIHPSHESRLTPPRSQAGVSPASFSASPEGTQSLTTQACRLISISSEYMHELYVKSFP